MASTSASGNKRKAACTDAFDELAPSSSASSPSSASTPMKRPSYDVFINHRGPDIKSTIATALYAMLTQRHLSVFLDEPELEYGDFFPHTLQAAMSSALVHIAIFSEGYAESPWCLAELSFMIKSGAPIIPIFYDVDPTDLRWVHQGKGKYVDAFEGYLRKNRYLGKLNEWKKALFKASFYKGEVIQNKDALIFQSFNLLSDHERQLKDIANTILKLAKRKLLWVADYPVGMEATVEDFERNTIHSIRADQGIQVIGIWGMGGSGKTTLAKELYNKYSSMFKWSSFVSNVRDASTKGLLYERQQKIFKDLCVEDVGFFNIEEGKETLLRNLRSVKVFIVLDDVDHMDQLVALMPSKDRLESGSLIIVTTREDDVLKYWPVTTTYKMRALDPIYAKQLFSSHAFGQPLHQDGYEELVEKFLEACNRLPLSLKVIGRQLKGEFDKEIWESVLHKVMTVVPNDIQEILKISYDNLDHQEKEMFLDVACFFIGEESSLVIEIWNGLGWSGQQGLKRIFNKCLVEFDGVKINMHDHIRDLGRSIATSQSPYRFGLPKTIINVQNQKEKRIGIHGIIATRDQVDWNFWGGEMRYPKIAGGINGKVDEFHVRFSEGGIEVDTNCGIWWLSPSSVGLKYLAISGDSFSEVLSEVSRDLVWLRWFKIGQPNLPTGLVMKNLRVLEVFEEYEEGHLEKLWVDSEAPLQLRHLLISGCRKFQGFPKSIGRLNHLKKIVITHASNMWSLPDEFCLIKPLEHLTLFNSGLQSLPINLGNLTSLRHLDLSESRMLRRLPASFKNLSLLQHLNLTWCTELTLKSEKELNCLQNVTKLEYLDLKGCERLEELPRHIANNVSLTELRLGCPLRELPENIGQLSKLRLMFIQQALLTSFPTSLGWMSSLTNLHIIKCPELKCLPDSLGHLSSLTELRIRNCPKLKCLPDSLGDLSSLTWLCIEDCSQLKCLPDSLGDLSSLTGLRIRHCPDLKCLPDSLGDLSSLTELPIIYCTQLKCLPDSLGDLSSLTWLCIEDCPQLKCLPDSLGDLSSLTGLRIRHCPDLKCLPDSLGDLSSLTELDIINCPQLDRVGEKSVAKAMRQLSNLQSLSVVECPISGSSLSFGSSSLKHIKLEETQVCRISCSPHLKTLLVQANRHLEEIEALPMTLESIYLQDCEMLKKIASLARSTSLRRFHLEGCNRIVKIEGIENCIGLKELSIESRMEVPGIESLEHLRNLRELKLTANKGAVIERCIQRKQEWPSQSTIICARAVPDAASLLQSLLPSNVEIVESISNQKIESSPELMKSHSSHDGALMLCFVINCVSSQATFHIPSRWFGKTKIEKGRWAWVGVYTPRSSYSDGGECRIHFDGGECGEEDEVEKGVAVMEEEGTVMEAFRKLWPLFIQS